MTRATALGALLIAFAPAPGAVAQVADGKAALDESKAADADLAEWKEQTPDFDKMRTPDSPAFVVLGVSPTEIQRPGTPMGVASSLSGFVTGGNAAIPRNLALEVAPYWLYGHPDLTAQAYEEGGWRNIYRTLTLSVGTKQTDRQTVDAAGVTTDHSDSDIGIGVRARLYGSGPDKGKKCVAEVKRLQAAAQDVAKHAELSKDEMDALAKKHTPGSPEYLAAYQKLQAKHLEAKDLSTALESARKGLDRKCFDVTASTHGFALDIAGAADWTFPDSVATRANADLIAGAGWLTFAYSGEALTGAALGRYAGRQLGPDWQQLLDGGLRFIYKRDAFALSAEVILRARLSGPGDSTYKVDAVAEYKITGESWVSVAFGKTFATGQAGSLFSLANLNWAFGKPRID